MLTIQPVEVQPFEFAVIDRDGEKRVFSLPAMTGLPVSTVVKLQSARELGATEMTVALAQLLEDECPGLTDMVTVDQMTDIITAWGEFEQVKLGES